MQKQLARTLAVAALLAAVGVAGVLPRTQPCAVNSNPSTVRSPDSAAASLPPAGSGPSFTTSFRASRSRAALRWSSPRPTSIT
jgi:hypothetical protein